MKPIVTRLLTSSAVAFSGLNQAFLLAGLLISRDCQRAWHPMPVIMITDRKEPMRDYDDGGNLRARAKSRLDSSSRAMGGEP
jgi:hypothetical protein